MPDPRTFKQQQHSRWPALLAVPDGWRVVFGEAERQECLDYVEKNWTDIRPLSSASVRGPTP